MGPPLLPPACPPRSREEWSSWEGSLAPGWACLPTSPQLLPTVGPQATPTVSRADREQSWPLRGSSVKWQVPRATPLLSSAGWGVPTAYGIGEIIPGRACGQAYKLLPGFIAQFKLNTKSKRGPQENGVQKHRTGSGPAGLASSATRTDVPCKGGLPQGDRVASSRITPA